ncbi:lipoprotein [Gracilibacillus suaedae]|uniref:lipoprotein n=1 Tax=Gracilibacillus suaedae TaxID=2820273 RepID=UPI001ABE70CB|nr:lipoprotein [Gracilibacillus suaedae]
MKKYILFLLLLFVVAGCSSNNLIQEDFEKDTNQILELLDTAHGENRSLNEEEDELFNDYMDKYIVGEYMSNEDAMYEMNGLEKEIVRKLRSMTLYTDESDNLESEKGYYEADKELVLEYLQAKSVPDELKDKHPTYETYDGLHPKFVEDARVLFDEFDPLVNGETNEFYSEQVEDLDDFLINYAGEGFEVDGKHYLTNEDMNEINTALTFLQMDIEEGSLQPDIQRLFNEAKETIAPTE